MTDDWSAYPTAAQGATPAADPWAAFPTAAPPSDGGGVQTFKVGASGELVPNGGRQPGMADTPTLFPGFQQGLADPYVGAAQLGAHLLSPVAPSLAPQMDQYVKSSDAEFKQNYPDATTGGRMLGNIVSTAPIAAVMPGAAAEGLAARTLSGAASGAATGVLQPTVVPDGGSFTGEKLEQGGLGAAGGAAGTVASSAVARMVQPLNDKVQLLMGMGVRPTPGQILGGAFNKMESAATSIPLAGDAINNARYRSVLQFNHGAINDALAPIGERLDEGTKLGRAAIDEMARKVSDGYDSILPQLRPKADGTFLDNMAAIQANAKFMPPDRRTQFEDILKGTLFSRMSPGGGMTGEGFKEADSKLGAFAREYRNSLDTDMRQLGGALLQAQVELRGMVRRSNPDLAPVLDANNLAYAKALRVQTAAGRQGADEGIFTPAQYSSAVRQLDPTLRKSGFARGNAFGQDLSDAAKSVLGKNTPDSGTAYRTLTALGALGTAAHFNPAAAIGMAGGGAGLLGAYSPLGQGLLAHVLASRPAFAAPLAQGIRAGAPLAATTGGLLAQ